MPIVHMNLSFILHIVHLGRLRITLFTAILCPAAQREGQKTALSDVKVLF